MPTIAELILKVDSSQVDSAKKSLDGLAASSTRVSNTTRKSNKAAADDFTALAESIDPVRKRMRELENQQTALKTAFASGNPAAISNYKQLNSIIEGNIKRINDLGATTGKTAKEINFALRGLPAQFTDIAVSLQGGQAPLTVFLQQGGQLKDMFGGVGPAFRAMAGYIMGLINPLTIAAAGLGTLAIGFVLGSKEASNFNKVIQQTGNASSTSVAELNGFAEAMDSSFTTASKAAKTLVEVAASGKIASTSFLAVASAAIEWEKATGTATEDTIANFVKIREKPVEAINELNDKMNFLTGETYRQIRAFAAQGDAASAASLAEFEYAKALEERSKSIQDNLGIVEKSWGAVTSAAKEGWDAILGVGRDASEAERLAEAASIQNFSGSFTDKALNFLPFGSAIRAYRTQGKDVEKAATAYQDTLADIQREGQERQIKELESFNERQKVKAVALTADLIESGKTNAKKLADEISAYEASVRQANANEEIISLEDQEKAKAAIRQKYENKKDLKVPKAKKEPIVREDAATKLLATMKQQEASLQTQLSSNTKLGTQAQAYARLQQQLADIQVKAKTEALTKDQQSLLANKESLLAQQAKNVAVEQEIKAKQELVKLQATQAAIDQQVANDRQKYQDALIGTTSSDKEAERLRERNRLEQEYQRQLQQLARQRNAGEISQGNYDASVQAYKKGLDERKSALEKHYKDLDNIQSDWSVGAKKAWSNYLEEGRNVASLTQGFFTSSFSSIEDAIVGFVTTGKLSFKDLAVSILSELAKVATKIAANQALEAIFGSTSGGGTGGGWGAVIGAISSAAFAKGGAFNGNAQFFAKGGTFTNSVVNSPTAFNTGSGLGVMGEAGPEAIMPLTRTSDGQLGVTMAGGGATSVVAPVGVTVNVTSEGGGMGSQGNTETQGRAVQMAIKSEVEKAIQVGLQPGGSIWRSMNGR